MVCSLLRETKLPLAFVATPSIFSNHSPETQADALEFPVLTEPGTASGQRTRPPPRPADSPPSPFPALLFSKPPDDSRITPHAGNETPGPQVQIPHRTACLCRRARGRERLDHAQAGADVRDPQAARGKRNRHHRRRRRRGSLRRLRLPARAGSELPARPGRHLRLARARSAASACAPAIPSRARSAPRKKASATSRCSRSTRSISRTPRRRATRSTSTT